MISRFFKAYFWGILIASIIAWGYIGFVSASSREAILIEDRITGIDSKIIKPGEFRFLAERAVPGRISLHPVVLSPRFLSYKFEMGLLQSEILDLDDSFKIKIALRLQYSLDPDKLQELFQRLDQPDWNRLDGHLTMLLNTALIETIAGQYRNEGDLAGLKGRLNDYLKNQALNEWKRLLGKEGIDIIESVLEQPLYVPDAGSYLAMTARGNVILQNKLEMSQKIQLARAQQEAEKIKDLAYMSRLEKIGELLKRYPNLRDYLAIDRLSGNVQVMVVPSDRWFPGDAELKRLLTDRAAGGGARPPEAAEPVRPPENGGEAGRRFQDMTPP